MLKGTLDDFDLRFIFRFLSYTHKTGKLTVAGPAGGGRVFFRAGEVYHAESDLRRQGFGRKLINSGKLTEEQLRQTLEYCAAQGKGLGEGLVAKGVVGRRDLELVLREEIEDVALSLFRNESGRFSFAPGEQVDSDTLILVRVEALLEDDSEAFKSKIPVLNPPSVTAAIWEDAAARQISISAEEWSVIASIDGRRSLADIAARLGMGDFAVMRSLRRLVSAGLVSLPGDPGMTTTPGAHAPSAPPASSGKPPPPPPRRASPPPPPPPPPPARFVRPVDERRLETRGRG